MKKASWKDAVEIIGITAIVASLLFVGLQLKQEREIAIVELDMGALAGWSDAANLIATNSDLWVKGNAGEKLNAAEAATYFEIISLINTRKFGEYRANMELGRVDDARIIRQDWSGFLHQNPGARQVWLDREMNLIRYRQLLSPEEEHFSFWVNEIESDLTTIDGKGE